MDKQIQNHNLKTLYERETTLQRYIRLTVGENAKITSLLWHELLLGICTGLPGIIGLATRNFLYNICFKGFNNKSFIGRQVTLRCPNHIHIAEDVVIDDFAQLIATSREEKAISIGSKSFVRSFAMLNSGPPNGFIHIGLNSSIGQSTILYGNGGLIIGNNVMISGQCFIVASSHNYESNDTPITSQGITAKGITIEDNAWIGAGVKILDGVTIGEGAIVGANSVVTKSVKPHSKVVGIPAYELKNENSS